MSDVTQQVKRLPIQFTVLYYAHDVN